MSEENKKVELKDEELENVNGGISVDDVKNNAGHYVWYRFSYGGETFAGSGYLTGEISDYGKQNYTLHDCYAAKLTDGQWIPCYLLNF